MITNTMNLHRCWDCEHEGRGIYVPRVVPNHVKGVWEVQCIHCPTFTWGLTQEEAVKAWESAVWQPHHSRRRTVQ